MIWYGRIWWGSLAVDANGPICRTGDVRPGLVQI